jgi:hypothetical protein
MSKKYIRKNMNPYTIYVLLMPKKNRTWSMCVDFHAINNITVKYKHLIHRLGDMLVNYMVYMFLLRLI